MTTDKPEVLAYFISHGYKWGTKRVGVRLLENHDPSNVIEDWNYDPLVRLSDYEAMKADRDHQYDMKVKAREQREEVIAKLSALHVECERLRKDAEFGYSVLSKREPGKKYGCHCDLDEGVEPDECVIDLGERLNCIYAENITVKEQCVYWRVIASDAPMKHYSGGYQPIGSSNYDAKPPTKR